jgi:sugar/nucleoside kinase (ribokinase family)
MIDICCIGHITHDRIITPRRTVELNGGTSYYFSYSLNHMPGMSYKLVTSLASRDMKAVDDMRAAGIDVDVVASHDTVFFENAYGDNMDNRRQRVLAKADPFSYDSLKNVRARYIHLGSLLADDFSSDVIKMISNNGILSVDAQGFLRYVDGENVVPCDWKEKKDVLQYVDILKVNEFEVESLTGYKDMKRAARLLASWGVGEVVMTFGSYGSIIYAGGKYYEIEAFKPHNRVDATGCGDTYAAGYIYMRSQGAGYEDAGRFAAAMATLNIEKTGPFNGTVDDIVKVMNESKE